MSGTPSTETLPPRPAPLQAWVFSSHADIEAAAAHYQQGDLGLVGRLLKHRRPLVGALWVMHDDEMLRRMGQLDLSTVAYGHRLAREADGQEAIALRVHSSTVALSRHACSSALTVAAGSLAISWFSADAQRERVELGFQPAFILNGGATLHTALLAALAHQPGWQASLIHLGSLADEVVELDRLVEKQACSPTEKCAETEPTLASMPPTG